MGSRAQLGANVSVPPASAVQAGTQSAADFTKLQNLPVITSIGAGLSLAAGVLAAAIANATTAVAGLMSAADKLLLDKLSVYRYTGNASNAALTSGVDTILATVALPDAGVYHVEGQANIACNNQTNVYMQAAAGGTPFAVSQCRIFSGDNHTLTVRGQVTVGGATNVTLVLSVDAASATVRGTDSSGRSPMITLLARKVG